MKTQHTLGSTAPRGRDPLQWLVVNPDGRLLAVLDSESEAFHFTRNRGHAHGAVYMKAACDYAAAPELLEALQHAFSVLEKSVYFETELPFWRKGGDGYAAMLDTRAAIANATEAKP